MNYYYREVENCSLCSLKLRQKENNNGNVIFFSSHFKQLSIQTLINGFLLEQRAMYCTSNRAQL